ncbi:MAG: signal peptidase I [Thermoplasmatota archaeon]|jgi:signal peptidase
MWYIILSLLTIIYLLINLVLPSIISGFIEVYVIQPLLWISLTLAAFLIARHEGLNIWSFKKIRRWEIGRTPFEAALLTGGFQVALTVIAGLLVGFGESPYSHTISSILINIVFIFSMIFGIELSRAYLIKKGSAGRRNITLVLGLVTLLFMIISIAPRNFVVLNFSKPAEAVKFLGETLIPLLAMGLFASYMAYLGGALPAIGYMGVLQAFEWFSPLLPNLDWALAALIGTLAPAIGFIIIQNSIQLTQPGARRTRRRTKIKDPALAWTGIAIISLLIIFFSFGYLGVQPTVIYSGSMRPALDVGDVVIISKVPIDDIQEGDIIQYRTENVPIVHRVYEISGKSDKKVFITKGDANDAPDSDPILAENVMGKVIFNLPKIGWITISIKSLINKIGFNI